MNQADQPFQRSIAALNLPSKFSATIAIAIRVPQKLPTKQITEDPAIHIICDDERIRFDGNNLFCRSCILNQLMNPRIVALSGPLKGSSIEVTGELSIGRESSNSASVMDPSVSRRHSILKQDGDHFVIVDLNSRNGTVVNGLPVKERILQNEDRISVGVSTFLFITEEADHSTGDAVDEPQDLVILPTAHLKMEDAIYLRPETLLQTVPLTERTVRVLDAFLRIRRVMHTISGTKEFHSKLMELLFEIFPAKQGAMVLLDDQQQITSTYGYDRMEGPSQIGISRTIVDQVIQQRTALLSNNIQETGKPAAKSLRDLKINSLLAVPLILYERLRGVLYLGTTKIDTHFNEDDLHLITAIAGVAVFALENNQKIEWLENENHRLRDEIEIEHNMIGESAIMQKIYQTISRVAPADSTVLITGESGTGKELVAHAIHKNSSRAANPFIVVNCAALTETLLESELFGHEKGAFTGAIAQKKGKLEVADSGTVFLDEIGEMNQTLQSKLLRVLQEREFERVGGTKQVRIDVRFTAATNRNLQDAVKEGAFRQDLFYRLNVVSIRLPSLRERREDIPLLAMYFASKYGNKTKRGKIGISTAAREILMRYDWPGNVRELENAIERAVVLGGTDTILPEDLPESILETSSIQEETTGTSFHQAVNEAKRAIVQRAISQASGNYSDAARSLGLHPNNFHRLLRSLNLKP